MEGEPRDEGEGERREGERRGVSPPVPVPVPVPSGRRRAMMTTIMGVHRRSVKAPRRSAGSGVKKREYPLVSLIVGGELAMGAVASGAVASGAA